MELAAAIAAGRLDAWSGRFVYTGVDDPEKLHAIPPQDAARQLRLRPYGPTDPQG